MTAKARICLAVNTEDRAEQLRRLLPNIAVVSVGAYLHGYTYNLIVIADDPPESKALALHRDAWINNALRCRLTRGGKIVQAVAA